MKKGLKTKVVVTGGAGFIGSNLTDALVRAGYDVHVIDNLSGGKKENVNPRAVLHIIDITNLKKIQPIFRGARYVFHLAALPRVQHSIEHPFLTHVVNVDGTLNVLIASSEAKVKRVIYSASSAAYGDQVTMPLHEGMHANPKSPYGLHKYVGEAYCKVWSEVYGLPTVSLRYFNVYGPRNNPEGAYALVIAKFMKQRKEGKPMTITGDGKQTRDFTHVKDVVQANILAMKSLKVGKGEVINIGCGKNQSVNYIAKLVGGPVKHVKARLEPRHTLANNTLAKKLLGWKPTISIEEGIKELKKISHIL
ncbi:MAG: NAD-dependent epimerase/dehydratase family protein [Candidatus Pacebacteria bacterium]|nr:NAD-dependent epimerase/dehydratase family protein [Candidatus Paceibacterota bacterium]MDD5357430.1 NAD-dependent epimerase/dehydratase family protein [Candidatus Paceibacterota bacterium]